MKGHNLKHSNRSGMALIVVLAMVALLTGLVLAFFLRAVNYRNLANSSFNDFKTGILAQSALQIVVSDLKQEVLDGSTPTATGNETLYLPTTGINILPVRSGNPAPDVDGDPAPNLIRRSVRSDAIADPGIPSRASAVSSADPSLNRKFISPARWNKHYLIPRDPDKYGGANSDKVGTDPIPGFEAPDWVFLTEKGPEVLTTSKKSVIGRYAYAIYDQGGLLDINVAGYPSNTPVLANHPAPDPHKALYWGSGGKGTLAFADLRVLGLTQDEIDQIVGWRTYATSQPGGVFPNLSFDAASALRFYDFTKFNATAFLRVADDVWTSGGMAKTNQLFTSRQQLLKLRSLLGFPQDALQYLATFTRDLERPGFIPNPNRAKIQSSPTNNAVSFGTGNDAHGADRESDPVEDINPPLPKVVVKTTFTRVDGTQAEPGDPLLKHRFPLSRLGKILRTATASKNESDPIYRDFGLYRDNASDPWRYDHGDATGILRLDQVAEEGREPDFFELLKAGINVGTLGKSAALSRWDTASSHAELQHSVDTLVNLQLLQIGANIIDQYDEDGYPVRIAFAGDLAKEVRGVESLPYLHRLRMRFVRGPTTAAAPPNPASNPGTMILNPEIWNPHASDTPTDAPTRFRARAEGTLGASVPTTLKLVYTGTAGSVDVSVDWAAGGSLTFETQGSHFREPTILVKPNVPSGTLLSGPTRSDNLAVPQETVTGIVMADFECVYNGGSVNDAFLGEPDHGPVTVYLEYWDGSSFQPYDQIMFEWVNSKFAPKGFWGNYTAKIKYTAGARTDPRTSRWGMSSMELFYLIEPLNLATYTFPTSWPSLSMPPYGPKERYPQDRGFLNAFSSYPNNDNLPNSESKHRGFTQGYWSQNTVRNQKGFFNVADKPFYNRDPDGIARRAMGAYSSDPDSGGSYTTEEGLPLVTGNKKSRPVILNRPFRSVAELGHTFRGTPWKNIDFSFPESGDAALMDIFCIQEPANTDGKVAGKVNLNTRQIPVLQAILAGAITDEISATPGTLTEDQAKAIAAKLVERTTSTDADKGPLLNRSELVGRWKGTGASPVSPSNADPDEHYTGFSSDIGTADGVKGTPVALVASQRDSIMRALSDVGTTRSWNLLIDVVAQSGKFPTEGATLDKFMVEGEKRYWLHLSMDRLTGEILDKQLELVTE